MIPLPLKGSTLDMVIADTARQLGVDLVIVGAQSKSRWRFFRRRLSERVRDRLENIVVMAPEQVDQVSLPPKNEFLAAQVNSSKEKNDDKQGKASPVHARV